MKIVFLGTPGFAVPSLRILVENGYHMAAVVTAPDRPAGRGLLMHPSAVKQYAAAMGLKVLQPDNLKNETFINELKQLSADLFIIVAFRMLPEKVWTMPPLGSFNLHASLLPQYRGAAPINHAIINGETKTGITTFFLQHEIDTGHIILQQEIDIQHDMNAGSLHDLLSIKGSQMVLETVRLIESGKAISVPQPDIPEGLRKKAPKITKETCIIHWKKNAEQVNNLIRGLSPFPGAHTTVYENGTEKFNLKIFSAKPTITNPMGEPGKIQTDHKQYLRITTSDGFIEVLELQVAGKKRMTTLEFLRGYKLSDSMFCR